MGIGLIVMTDDQLWRTIIGAAVIASIPYIKPKIMPWLYKLGYRDWKEVQREKRQAYIDSISLPEPPAEPHQRQGKA